MFTAKITKKEEEGAVLALTVEFTDGVDTYTEVVRPQDEAGFKYFVKQRLESLETSKKLKTDYNVGKEVIFEPTDNRTQAEKDRDDWLGKYSKWISIKKNLIDTGVVPAENPQVVAFLDDVKAGFKPAYINFI